MEGRKVLLIEDNPGDVRLVREMLDEAAPGAFELVWRDSLSAGLERLSEGGMDIMLLDLNLPDSQGLNTFSRTMLHAIQVPVLVLTSMGDEAQAIRAVRNGAQDYLVKGQIDGKQLTRSIHYAIARSKMGQERRQLAVETRRLNQLQSELDLIDASYTLSVRLKQAEKEPLFLPQLRQLAGAFEKGLGKHCVTEEKEYLEMASTGNAQKLAGSLLTQHHELQRRLRDLNERIEKISLSTGPVEARNEMSETLNSLRGLLDEASAHAEKENELLFLLGHGT